MKKLILSLSLLLSCAATLVQADTRGFCTADIDVWGNASICNCDGESTVYSEVTGTCMSQTTFSGLGRQGDRPEGICTFDIGEYGNPSVCHCAENKRYDLKSGACVSEVSRRIISVTGKLKLSGDVDDIRYMDARLITPEGATFNLNFRDDQQHMLKMNGELIMVTGERVYLRAGSLNAPEGTLITVDSIFNIK